jgi:hypothetical protein
MSPSWAVTLLVSLLALVNSIAVITLLRRTRSARPAESSAPYGPPVGTRLDVGAEVEALAGEADRILFVFVSPMCGACREMLPEFAVRSPRLPVVLVGAVEPSVLRDHLTAQGIDLPLVTGAGVFDANHVPGPPYAVVTTRTGMVLARGGANRAEQIDLVLAQADLLLTAIDPDRMS